jgi:hypothetical protein
MFDRRYMYGEVQKESSDNFTSQSFIYLETCHISDN